MLHKRLDCGSNGYQPPFVPRAARSSRKRGHVQMEVKDNETCAFDLLVSVAGTLLLEGESCKNDCSVKDKPLIHEDVVNERCDEGKKLEYFEQGSVHVPPLSLSRGLRDVSLAPPFLNMSDHLNKDSSLDKIELNSNIGLGKQVVQSENRLPVMNDSLEQHDCGPELTLRIGPDTHSSGDPKFFDRKPHALATCDGTSKQCLGKDEYPCGSLSSPGGSNVKLVKKDDDENLSECTQPSAIMTNRSLARIGDRRIRKLLAAKYWRVAPNLKDVDPTDSEMHCVYRSRKMGFKRQRSQRIYPFKKRKLYHYSSLSIPDGDFDCKGVYDSPENSIDSNASGFGTVGYGVDGPSSRVADQSTTLPCRESHVKLRIRSFRVPEIFIEMPETATIGSLKRAVMETVTTLLGGGLHVGVVLQGKKIRDDSRTLLQSGICHDDKLDSLGFTLEPSPTQTCQPVCSRDKSLLLSTNVTEPLSRFPGTGTYHLGDSRVSSDHPDPVPNSGNLIESDHDSTRFSSEISTDKSTVDSQALISVPNGTSEALATMPANQKSKQSDIGQRRIRRPFSVAEVEALVQAVEMLGTGRWRDVKLKAFDNVEHRTYVDLKDKWKTLVHTARIAPQQRRGQPVPQELLDRVLAAHTYWSQQQAKQQIKQLPSEAGLP